MAGALAAMETATTRVASDMLPRELANTMYSFASVDRSPGAETWAAMDAAAGAAAPRMNAHDVSTSMYAYARLGREPSAQTQEALGASAGAVAATMTGQDLSNLLWAYGTLGIVPSVASWAALDAAVAREAAATRGCAPRMIAQHVSNSLWGYAKLRIMPGDDAWAALEGAAEHLAPVMSAQNASNLVLACGTLGRAPAKDTWNAVGVALGRLAPEMTPQGLANTVWSLATLSTLRGVELPSSYGALWEAAGGFEARDFSEASLTMLFQVHLMHRFATGSGRRRTSKRPPSSSSAASSYAPPSWLMKEAQGAWKKATWDRNTVSTSHRKLAGVFSDLGVRHEVERVTDDGYFSMDIYLPDHDVCVEVDGPSHFHRPEYASNSREPSSRGSVTRTAKTELRDLFLAERCATFLSLPYFEFDACTTAKQRRAYVKDMLAKEAGIEL